MLVKLAIYNDKKQKKHIEACCEQYSSYFIPLLENKFGILTKTQYKRLYGEESSDSECNCNIASFVNIYKCAKGKQSGGNLLFKMFRNTHGSPYVGMLLDNQFFLNILTFCETHPVKFNSMNIRVDYGDSGNVDDFEQAMNLFSSNQEDFKILRLYLILDDDDIIFDESGYIDIASEEQSFNRNEKLIMNMIIFGIQGDIHE